MKTWRQAADAFEGFCTRRFGWALLLGSLTYLAAMAIQSALKPLWYDEFFTHFLAMLPVHRLWNAVQSGAEVHPPLAALGAHAAQALLGPTALASRLPEVVAYWGMSVAVFFLVRRYLSASWSLAPVLFIFLSDAGSYATEARPYAIVMCCAASGLLCWQNISSRWRWLCLSGVLLSLAAAVSANVMGVLIAIPAGTGELYRTWRRRRIDLPFWIAAFAGVSVVLLYSPMIRMAQRYVTHNSQGLGLAASLFNLFELPLLPVLFPGAAVLIAIWVFRGMPAQPALRDAAEPPPAAWIAATALFLLPVCQKLLEHWTRSVNLRYTLSYVIGSALLFT